MNSTEQRLAAVNRVAGTLVVDLGGYLRQPTEAAAQKAEEVYLELDALLRDVLGEHAPARVQFTPRRRPMSGGDLIDTLAAVRDVQNLVTVCLSGWLRAPTEAAAKRLRKAKLREAELHGIIVGELADRSPGRPSRADAVRDQPSRRRRGLLDVEQIADAKRRLSEGENLVAVGKVYGVSGHTIKRSVAAVFQECSLVVSDGA